MRRAINYFAIALLLAASWRLDAEVTAVSSNAPNTVLRVTTWDLQPDATVGKYGWSAPFQKNLRREAAEKLKELKPDVILLQGVSDWSACQQLVLALKPNVYYLSVCSAFPNTGRGEGMGQTAILTKTKALISWSDAWKTNGTLPTAAGGYAFAAIRIAGKSVGFFSIDMGNERAREQSTDEQQIAGREDAARQLVQQMGVLQSWRTNRPEALLVAGNFNTDTSEPKPGAEKTLFRLEQLDFNDALMAVPASNRGTINASGNEIARTLDHIFIRGLETQGLAEAGSATLTAHKPVTVELDLAAPTKVAAVEITPTLQHSIEPANSPAALVPKGEAPSRFALERNAVPTLWFWLWVAATLLLITLLFLFSRRSTRRTARVTMSSVVVRTEPFSEPIRLGAATPLTQWLKRAVVQRLIGDRRTLIAAQEAAARKIQAVDERLDNIEAQMQARNREYENRIDELMKELEHAREDNHELIREKITHLKAEIEKERLRALLGRTRRN